jgi:starch synthase
VRILLGSSEVYPWSKTGGLADMVSALAKALGRRGHQVGLVTPLYLGIREQVPELKRLDLSLDLPLGGERRFAAFWTLEPSENLTLYFLDHPAFFHRETLYQQSGVDYPDNAARFLFLSKAIAQLGYCLPWTPELIHLHDWQTTAAALFIHHQRRFTAGNCGPKVCATVHNLAYQGVFPVGNYTMTNLPWSYFTPDGVEFYGQLNCLKAGIAWADALTTVSPRYAREITTQEFGCGLEGLLRHRQNVLTGILNGVDYDEWNLATDPHIPNRFSADDLGGKLPNKLELQREFGLPVDSTIPLFGSIGRLVEQKGLDILLGALEEMLSANIQVVLLGTGAPNFQQACQDLARRYPNKMAAKIDFQESLSHRIEAGCDFFLMPSRFEPCGLNQMYSLRYGTIPIVRRTGGLEDSVIDIRDNLEQPNGIKFEEHSSSALAKAINKALALYAEPELHRIYQLNGMSSEFSWDRTAAEYEKVYERVLPAAARSHPAALELQPTSALHS